MSDRNHSIFWYLFRKRYDRFKPLRSREIHRRFEWNKQPQAVQQLISEGYFNDPVSAAKFLKKHKATTVAEIRHKLPNLYRPRSFRQRLRRFLLYVVGETEGDGLDYEQRQAKAKKARLRSSGSRRIPLREVYTYREDTPQTKPPHR